MNVQTRLWTWYRISPVPMFIWFWVMCEFATAQQGWFRWVWWLLAVISILDFFKKADKEWLRK